MLATATLIALSAGLLLLRVGGASTVVVSVALLLAALGSLIPLGSVAVALLVNVLPEVAEAETVPVTV